MNPPATGENSPRLILPYPLSQLFSHSFVLFLKHQPHSKYHLLHIHYCRVNALRCPPPPPQARPQHGLGKISIQVHTHCSATYCRVARKRNTFEISQSKLMHIAVDKKERSKCCNNVQYISNVPS